MPPIPKPQPKQKKNKDIPSNIRKYVIERDKSTCQSCGQPYNQIHHITKRNALALNIRHDPRNLECLCWECHYYTENDRDKIQTAKKFRQERERKAVEKFGWFAGREMSVEEWEDKYNVKI